LKRSVTLDLESLFQTHAARSKQTKKHRKNWHTLDCQRKLLASFYSRFVLKPFFWAYFRRKMGFFEFLAILAKKYTINYEPFFCAISKVTPLKRKPQ